MDIKPQNNIIRTVKNRFKNIIDGILIRYDNYVYYKQLERFFKDNRTVLEKLKDKVNLAIACLIRNISNYNYSGLIDGHPHRLWVEAIENRQLRRTERNSKK